MPFSSAKSQRDGARGHYRHGRHTGREWNWDFQRAAHVLPGWFDRPGVFRPRWWGWSSGDSADPTTAEFASLTTESMYSLTDPWVDLALRRFAPRAEFRIQRAVRASAVVTQRLRLFALYGLIVVIVGARALLSDTPLNLLSWCSHNYVGVSVRKLEKDVGLDLLSRW